MNTINYSNNCKLGEGGCNLVFLDVDGHLHIDRSQGTSGKIARYILSFLECRNYDLISILQTLQSQDTYSQHNETYLYKKLAKKSGLTDKDIEALYSGGYSCNQKGFDRLLALGLTSKEVSKSSLLRLSSHHWTPLEVTAKQVNQLADAFANRVIPNSKANQRNTLVKELHINADLIKGNQNYSFWEKFRNLPVTGDLKELYYIDCRIASDLEKEVPLSSYDREGISNWIDFVYNKNLNLKSDVERFFAYAHGNMALNKRILEKNVNSFDDYRIKYFMTTLYRYTYHSSKQTETLQACEKFKALYKEYKKTNILPDRSHPGLLTLREGHALDRLIDFEPILEYIKIPGLDLGNIDPDLKRIDEFCKAYLPQIKKLAHTEYRAGDYVMQYDSAKAKYGIDKAWYGTRIATFSNFTHAAISRDSNRVGEIYSRYESINVLPFQQALNYIMRPTIDASSASIKKMLGEIWQTDDVSKRLQDEVEDEVRKIMDDHALFRHIEIIDQAQFALITLPTPRHVSFTTVDQKCNFAKKQRMFCSELVIDIRRRAELNVNKKIKQLLGDRCTTEQAIIFSVNPYLNSAYVSPGKLYREVSKRGATHVPPPLIVRFVQLK